MELFDWFALQNRHCEFHIGFRILVARLCKISTISLDSGAKAYVDFRILRNSSKGLVQCSVHFLGSTLEKSTAT